VAVAARAEEVKAGRRLRHPAFGACQRGTGIAHGLLGRRHRGLRGVELEGTEEWGGVTRPYWGTLSLWTWALDYADAEARQDDERLSELDSVMAMTSARRAGILAKR
jgi:hypothetical protein